MENHRWNTNIRVLDILMTGLEFKAGSPQLNRAALLFFLSSSFFNSFFFDNLDLIAIGTIHLKYPLQLAIRRLISTQLLFVLLF